MDISQTLKMHLYYSTTLLTTLYLYIPGDPYTSHADVAEVCSPPNAVNSLTVTAEIHPLAPNALEGSALHMPTASLPAPALTCSSDVDPLANEDTAHGEWLST